MRDESVKFRPEVAGDGEDVYDKKLLAIEQTFFVKQERPELTKNLRSAIENILSLYETDQRAVFYMILSEFFLSRKKDVATGGLLARASWLINSGRLSDSEEFAVKYSPLLSKIRIEGIEDLGKITEPTAFRTNVPIYKQYVDDIRKVVDTSNFSELETILFDTILSKLESPLQNPNVQIKDGNTLCYYDRCGGSLFRDSMNNSIECIRRDMEQHLSAWEEKNNEERDF